MAKEMTDRIRARIDELRNEWVHARHEHPRIAYSVVAVFAAVAILVATASTYFLINLPKGLPDEAALSKIGEMDQATRVFDASDQLAFTIYKEQRIDVPLAEMSPHLIQAVVATEDQRFYDHHGF